MLGENHPFYMMRNHLIQSFNKANSEAIKSVSRKRTATDSTLSSTHSEAKIPRKENTRQDMATSSPQENKNKVSKQHCFYMSRAGRRIFFKLLKIGWVNFETPLKRLVEQKLTKFG